MSSSPIPFCPQGTESVCQVLARGKELKPGEQTIASVYDKLEFCNRDQNASEDDAKWDLGTLSEEIINDIEDLVPMKLQAE